MLVDMKNWQNFFKGKKVTQMGLGLLGRGVGDADFLARYGAEVLVTDLKSEKELVLSLEKVRACDLVVAKLVSWQLQGFDDSKISPHISLFTTFLPDLWNYYGGDM